MRVFLTGLVVLFSAALIAQTREGSQRPTGTASIAGVVMTDEATARPLRRVTVTLQTVGDARAQMMTVTDDAGRFSFSSLPAGNVTLIASRVPYVTTWYGARRAGATMGVPIALTEGQRLTGVTMRMARGAVLAGTLTDEQGKPMPSVAVRVQQVRTSAAGERTLTQVVGLGALQSSTDDRGQFRAYGLPPGDYVVSSKPRISGTGELRQPSSDELAWAERQIQSSTTPASAAASASAPAPAQPVTYANVFYPGTADVNSAAIVTLATGQERTDVNFRMLFVPTAHVDGSVTGPAGQPVAGATLTLMPKSGASGAGDAGALLAQLEVGLIAGAGTGRSGADGRFSIAGVEPGAYTLVARAGGGRVVIAPAPGATGPGQGGGVYTPAAAATRAGGAGGSQPLWAMTDVQVDGRDIDGVALTLAAGMNVSGTFSFDGRTPPADEARVSLTLNAIGGLGASAGGQVGYASANPVFNVANVFPGRYRLSASVGSWLLKSAMLNGRDVSDTTFEVKPGEDVSSIVITFTDVTSEISGQLTDAAGRPTSAFVLLLFPTDRSQWFAGSRRLRAPIGPATDGRFSFTQLLAGEYYLAALGEVSQNEWTDPQFLDQVVPAAIKIAVGPGEKKVQTVRAGGT